MSDTKNFIEELFKMAKDGSATEGEDPNYDAVMETFKVACPVKKINLAMEEPNFINGMFLMASADSLNILKEKADLSNLTDDTILFFTNQHIVELAHIFNGILYLIENSNLIIKGKRNEIIIRFINELKKAITYHKYVEMAETILRWVDAVDIKYLEFESYKEMIDRIGEILKLIPFVSYSTLDEIAEIAIKTYKEKMGDINNGDNSGE